MLRFRSRMLQCVAVCCRGLRCVAVCCGVSWCVAVCCSVLEHQLTELSHNAQVSLACVAVCAAECRRVSQSVALCCIVLQSIAVCVAVYCNTSWKNYCTRLRSGLCCKCVAVYCSVLQCSKYICAYIAMCSLFST